SEQELRLLNANLAASEAKYRGIVDHAPIGIFTAVDSRIIFSNRENWKLAGREQESDTDPERMWEAVHPEDRDATYHAFLSAAKQGVTFERIFRFLHPDGTVRKVLSRAIPIHDDAHTLPLVYQGFNVDITVLEQMRAQLSRAERLTTLGQVAAGIAHEIRNPLVGIGSTASLLLEEIPEEHEWRADLLTILRETRRLDRIVNQVVDYARPRELAPTIFSLPDLLKETLLLLNRSIRDKAITVNWTISDHVPDIEADRDQIKQVMLNVFQNAIEALPPKGRLDIRLIPQSSHQTNGVLITVHDYGKGIEAAILSRVFEPFFTFGKGHGTGLGLAICRNIVEAHGGDIQLRSEVGKGTTVGIWLPESIPIQVVL
ncbi:MAG: PAS domain S-box protein, partial [Nitrospirae bacterium]